MRRAAALLMPSGQRAAQAATPAGSTYGDNDETLAAQKKKMKKVGEKRKTPARAADWDPDPAVEGPQAPPTVQQRGGKRARRVSSPPEVTTHDPNLHQLQ
jgi:hypothetical protein